MVTYQEFKQMVLLRMQNVTDTEAVFFVNRLIAYTDEVVGLVINPPTNPPPVPPILPDIEPDGRGERSAGDPPKPPSPPIPPILPDINPDGKPGGPMAVIPSKKKKALAGKSKSGKTVKKS